MISHAAIPLALAWGVGRKRIPGPLLWTGVALAALPDLDVVAFKLGIPYASAFGHRGFSHSLLFAALVALAGAALLLLRKHPFPLCGWFLFVCAASHGVLDAFTSGGEGVAFLWPFSEARFFAPFRPIRVAPLHPAKFLSARGIAVLYSELAWVWFGSACAAAALAVSRRCVGASQPAR